MGWDVVPGGDMDENLNPDEPAVNDLLKALCEPGYAGELAGQQTAVAAFAAAAKEKEKAMASKAEKSGRRPWFSPARGAKLAAAAMAGSLVMGGVAAAAVTGSLPGPFQDVAHTLGAPGAQSDDPSAEPTESDSPDASPSASGTHEPGAGHRKGHGPSAFAVCWFVVHKTDGAAGGPWADHTAPSATPTPSAQPTDGTGDSTADPSDKWDHGRGEWSQAYARIKAAAGAQGQSVLDYCTALLANHPKPKGNDKHDKHGKGDGQQGDHRNSGRGNDGHGSSNGHGSSSGHGDGQGASGSGGSGDGGGGGSGSGGDGGSTGSGH